MPWTTPTLSEIRALNRDFVLANLPGADALPGNSPGRVLADGNAGLAYLVLLYLDWLSKQILPDTAEGEFLDRFGAIWVGGRKPATFATGTITVTGLNGTVLPLGTQLAIAGQTYETTEEITVGEEATSVAVRALSPGAAGNQAGGATGSLTTAVAGVDGIATVELISGGISVESDDSLRERVLFRWRNPPQGGADADYIAWARSVPGVTRAWAKQEAGIGTVTVRFMMDDDRPPLGIPDAVDVQNVAAYIDPRRPVAVKDLYVVAPIPYPISFTIRGLQKATASTVAAIEASVAKMFRERAEPGRTMYRSWVDEAISRAAGEDHHELDYQSAVMPSPGHIPVLGTILYGP